MLGLTLALATPAVAQSVRLDDLAFMVGHWRGEGARAPEEQWYPPRDGVMPGFFRWPTGGRHVLELLAFEETATGVTFRFRHFDPDITPWETEESNTYDVTRVADDCLYMERTSAADAAPAGIRYCRVDEETLVFTGRGRDEAWDEAGFVLTMRTHVPD